MPIDDAEKRRSAGGAFVLPFFPSVTSNAGKDQQWRQQAGWVYSGILAATSGGVPPGTGFMTCLHGLPLRRQF